MRDPGTNEQSFVEAGPDRTGCVMWFDDHLLHGIEPVNNASQFSLRIDGGFTPQYRELIGRVGTFGKRSEPTEVGLRGVLEAQIEGPRFLNEYNSPPPSPVWSEEDEIEEEEEVDTHGQVEQAD